MYRCHIRFEFFNSRGDPLDQEDLYGLSACFCHAVNEVMREENLVGCGKDLLISFKEVKEDK